MAKVSGIYVIQNTKNGKVYIGQAQDFQYRWKKHRYELTKGTHKNQHLQAAWNKYGEKTFKFYVLEYCAVEMLTEREQHFIDIYKPKGMCYNIAGDVRAPNRGLKLSIGTRLKMSEAQKGEKHHNFGKPMSDEQKRKISEANKGRIISDDHKRKLSAAARNMSAEHKRKLSETSKGRNVSAETRRAISEANKRRVISTETRRKISESNKGKTRSDETRHKLSGENNHNFGKSMSDEQKRKISETRKLREAQRKQQAANEAINDAITSDD